MSITENTASPSPDSAELYRMVMESHTCPYGIKSKDKLERKGFTVHDHHLKTREETDAFKEKHNVDTTPQIWLGEQRIGGYDELREYLGEAVKGDGDTTYRPVIVIFGMAAFMAIALSWLVHGTLFADQLLPWFVAIAMCFLSVQKLRDVESFSTMFLNYDLLAKRWVPYGYIYPYAEGLAGILMLSGALVWFSAPLMMFIGGVGAASVFKAVYIDKRELECACVGGGENVPLGPVSLGENVMMLVMGLWMLASVVM